MSALRSTRSRFTKPVLEILEDRYVLDAWGLNLDFGTVNTPNSLGYQQVQLDKFSTQKGFGWAQVTGLTAVDRPTVSSALDRSFHAGRNGTFLVNVPNGDYQVTLRLGDPKGATPGVVGLLENRLIISAPATAFGQMVESSYRITVTDNQLSLLLLSRGSTSSTFALNSMRITSVGTPPSTNQAPTNITLSSNSVQENRPLGTLIGTLTTTDPNVGDTHQYSFVTGTGSNDNALFTISNNQLFTNSSFDYEAQATRTIRLKATDNGGLSFEKVFTINVQNVNEAPTAISLSNSILQQNAAAGTIVGTLSTTDPDLNDSFTYTLVTGTGSTNNTSFTIQGNSLKTAETLPAGTYSIRVRSTDNGGLSFENVFSVTVTGNNPVQLVNKSNLQYVGAFRVPNYYDSIDEFSYGGTALAFNPTNNSLFMVGHYQAVTEISIPTTINNSSSLNTLTTASMLQPWSRILNKLPIQLTNTWDGAPIGGLSVYNGQLIGTQFAYYSGALNQSASHFVLDSLNLATANVHGLYQVGTMARSVAGFMTPVPAEWQAALGAKYLTGQADIPIIATTSSGPAAFGFEPSQLTGPETGTIIPSIPYLYYPNTLPLGLYEGPVNPIQNGSTQVKGMLFVPGTSTILYFGNTSSNYNGYGTPDKYGDTNSDGGVGPHALNGEYTYQIWAYDANDFVAVKQGLKQPWDVRPYNVWNLDFPYSRGFKRIGGVAFDPSTQRIYMTTMMQDREVPYSSLPLVQVFQLDLTPPTGPLVPQIGTLAATPSTLQPGAVPIGTLFTLTAGNVYSIQQGTSITKVAFYLDSNNDGILQKGSDQLMGYGSQLDISHNSTLEFSTSNMRSGSHTVFVQALDSNSVLGNTVSAHFTLL